MNKLSEEQKEELLIDYNASKIIINKLEEIFEECNFSEYEYYNIIAEIVSEYQTFKFKKENKMNTPYKNLKDIIIKVLNYKLRNVIYDDSKYEQEIKKLILNLEEE